MNNGVVIFIASVGERDFDLIAGWIAADRIDAQAMVTDTVGPSVVRDFRGAMVGRADKGLINTTGRFTAEARREATRDGAPAIDLVEGDDLCALLKDLGMGVFTDSAGAIAPSTLSQVRDAVIKLLRGENA